MRHRLRLMLLVSSTCAFGCKKDASDGKQPPAPKISASLRGTIRADDPPQNYDCIEAPEMRPAASGFLRLFTSDYISHRSPISLYGLMRRAHITPTREADQVQLGLRPNFVFSASSELILVSDASNLCPGKTVCSTASFPYELEGLGEIAVDFPSRMQFNIDQTNGLSFTLTPKLQVRITGPISGSGTLDRVKVSEDMLDYTVTIASMGTRDIIIKLRGACD